MIFILLLLSSLTATAAAAPPPLQLANVYHDEIDLTKYWISEKYDGVRAYWNGERLISRSGNTFSSPSWFTADFPNTPLDGELWLGRGRFADTSAVVRRHIPVDAHWRELRFMVFDLPAHSGPFDQRLQQLSSLITHHPSPYLHLVEQYRVASNDALHTLLDKVVEDGAEGLMLRRGDSLYTVTRNDDLLKLKKLNDAEAIVIAHLPGKGKYSGMLGALLVENGLGQQFRLGTGFTNAERANPPPVGTTVTYQFSGYTKRGLPRFARFLRIRERN